MGWREVRSACLGGMGRIPEAGVGAPFVTSAECYLDLLMTFLRRPALWFLSLSFAAATLSATSFVVPRDRDLVSRADAIVVGTAVESHSQFTPQGGVETVTSIAVDETIKGSADATIFVTEPGGTIGNIAMVIAGAPRFADGEKVLLFLKKTGRDRWSVADLAVGKFSFTNDVSEPLLLRDANDVVGWDPDLKVHEERARAAAPFLRFVREVEGGNRIAAEDYFVTESVVRLHPRSASTSPLRPVPLIAPYTATSYTMLISGSQGGRWAVFPNPVTFFSGTTQEAGAPGGGTTAINAAFASWDNDCGSNVNYVYGGTDNGTHTQGLHGIDGANTILFERDLSSWGVGPFSCSGNSYSGTLGIGGITNASGTNSVNGETFATTQEADVEMNRGLANCTVLFNNGDFNSALTHEVGHTLGFRHSDQNRASNAACTTDASLECSNQAIMKSFISTGINAALQAWDQHAVQAVYPGNICAPGAPPPPPPPPPTCTAPAISSQSSSTTINSGSAVTLSVTATGTAPLAYQWYIGTSGNTASPISGGTNPSIQVAPTATTSYWVRVSNSCGTVNSATIVVTVNAPPPPPRRVAMDFSGDGDSDLLWRNVSTNQVAIWELKGRTIANGSVILTIDPAWKAQGFGDFNGDGKTDVIWRNSSTGDVAMWEMNGRTITNGAIVTRVSDFNWQIQAFGDFNRDGRTEIIWRNTATGDVAMWELKGHTLLNGAVFATVSDLNWKIQTVGDFLGDGRNEIIWRNTATNELAMWELNGRTLVNGAIFATVSNSSWVIQGTGDFNGDKKSDIFWRNTGTGDTAMWEMSGRTVLNNGPMTNVSLAWQSEAFGDFNRDGRDEIIWRNVNTGEVAMWEVNGHQLLNGAVFTQTSSPSWHIQPPSRPTPSLTALGRIDVRPAAKSVIRRRVVNWP